MILMRRLTGRLAGRLTGPVVGREGARPADRPERRSAVRQKGMEVGRGVAVRPTMQGVASDQPEDQRDRRDDEIVEQNQQRV